MSKELKQKSKLKDNNQNNNNKQTRKVGTSEMSLVRNSSPDVYPAHYGVTWGIPLHRSMATVLRKDFPHILYLYTSSSFFFVSILHFFSLLFIIWKQKWCNTQNNPFLSHGLFHNKSHYKVDNRITDKKNTLVIFLNKSLSKH